MSFCFSALVGDTGMITEAMHDGLKAKLSDEGVGCRCCFNETRLISQYVDSRVVLQVCQDGCFCWMSRKADGQR